MYTMRKELMVEWNRRYIAVNLVSDKNERTKKWYNKIGFSTNPRILF